MTTTRVISQNMELQTMTEETTRKEENLLEYVPEKLREGFRKALHSKETVRRPFMGCQDVRHPFTDCQTVRQARLDLSEKELDFEAVTKFIIPFLNRYPPP